jgi:mRNA-degrading endonuclease RelE of RelBE toxin-antitoxin system
MNSDGLIPLRIFYTPKFKRDIKRLKKRYRSIKSDVGEFIEKFHPTHFPGDKLQGVPGEIYKARISNSDNNKGKSHGYRVIYSYKDPDRLLLVTIYSKSDQPNITAREINEIISEIEN